MIPILPTNLTEEKKKRSAKVIDLTSGVFTSYILCIGDNGFLSRIINSAEERVFVVNDTLLAKRVLKERADRGVKPAYVIFNIALGTKILSELVKLLRQARGFADVPLLVYNEAISDKERLELQKIGRIDDVITATVNQQEFADKIKNIQKIRQMMMLSGKFHPPKEKVRWQGSLNTIFKRTIDIITAGTSLLILSPLLLVIAVLIKLESKGPIFYISYRAGNRYKIFKFYKFRTMVADADKLVKQMSHLNQYHAGDNGPVFFKVSNDPRVTRLGSFLRNTSLDEIPQLLNVILGDMSLVGNRPLPLYEAATLTTDAFAERFLAPAGITGLWQIKKRGNKDMSVTERINLDINYAQNHSLLYDMWILANTPNALIQKDNV
jgi:lipopolysaccharide/colanic/teichoic acid biosynthesis glycosyltransferase